MLKDEITQLLNRVKIHMLGMGHSAIKRIKQRAYQSRVSCQL